MLLQLIRKWLKKILQIQISVIPEYFSEAAKDGTLLAKILAYYKVVQPDEINMIEETRDPAVAYENYQKYIKEWLSRINFELTESDIYELTHGEGTASASIFYEIYMRLQNKRGSVFPVKTRTHNFKIEKVSTSEIFLDVNPLCEPLIKEWDIINWERDHLASLMIKYMRSREEYGEYLDKRSKTTSEADKKIELQDAELFSKAELTEYTYDELIAQQKKALEMAPFEPNLDEAKRIMMKIKERKKERAEKNAMRLEMQHELLQETWKKISETEEEIFDSKVCEKLLKQSIHEKEIAEKLLEIRRQKEIIIQNRKAQDELENKQRDEEFIRKIFEDSLAEKMKWHDERMAIIEEHKRLYAEKQRIKALKQEKVCKEALDDIVDLAIKTAEYRERYGAEPDEYTKRDWATLFVKLQSIFDFVTPSQEIKQTHEDITEELEEIYKSEIRRQDVLDEQDFEDYVHFRSIWIIEEGLEEFVTSMELGMNCLGYAVHRLLLKKYPLPVPEKPELSQEIEISVCANNMTDLSRLDFLQRLLELKNVKVIRIEDATDFCIKSYEVELKTEFDEPFPEDDNLKEITPKTVDSGKGGKKGKKGKGKKEKGSKKGKGSKKDKASKKDKGSKKGKKGKKGKKTGSETEVVAPVFEEKQSQTPRLFPWEKIVFSNRAKLGRIAKQILGQNGVLDDHLLVEMFVEYLLSMPDIKGWVLINYPNTYEQAALLEQALSGKPVPKEYYDNVINKESLASIQLDQEEPVGEEEEEGRKEKEEGKPEEEEYEEEEEDLMTESVEIEQDTISAKIDEIVSEQQRKVTLQSELGRFSLSGAPSEYSGITVLDDWNVTSKERIAQLFPDLTHLAYSDDEIEQSENKSKNEKTCTCICNTPKQVDVPPSNAEESHHKESIYSDGINDDVMPEYEYEIMPEMEEPDECLCYLKTLETHGESPIIKTENENIQTDILGLEQDIDICTDEPHYRPLAEDFYEEKRISKVVPNPHPLEKEEYQTVLTGFIRLMPKEELDEEDDEYPIPIFKELERINGMEKFYCDQGCWYSLQYEEFNSDTIKCLAKMIIGDYSLPMKTSIEIFGEKYKEAMLEDGDHIISKKGKGKKKDKKKKKKGAKSKTSVKSSDAGKKKKGKDKKSKKSKSSKSSGKSKGGKKGKKGKKGKGKGKEKSEEVLVIEHEDKEVQVPIIEEVEEEEIREPRAGEPDWEYINLPLPEDVELTLANLWVNFEENYIKNFKDLFFNKRILLNGIAPYLAKARESVHVFIVKPDQKQYYLREFQKIINEFDLNLRNDPDTKEEILCRIEEFKEKLMGICDNKMLETEEERRNIIRENWLFHQFCQMTNNSLLAYQFEIDRLVDSLQFLSDYYIGIITKSLKEGYDYHKEILPKHECVEDNSEDFNRLFIETQTENDGTTEFHKCMDEIKNIALGFVDSMKPQALKPVNDMRKIFEPKQKKEKPKKKSKKAGSKDQAKKFELDEDVKENAERIFEEWECAISGEFSRMIVQLNVIRNEAFRRFDNVIAWIKKIFDIMYGDISERYENEIACVRKACELLAKSVERETIIQPELRFEDNHLVEIQIALFPEVPQEDYTDGTFTLKQIEFMVNVLSNLASSGYILKNTFLLLLQDIFYQDDSDEENYTPKIWRNLSAAALNALFQQMFDDENYLYWKDFIICNLMIPFPTREQMMDIRKQFKSFDPDLTETVNLDQFYRINYWFDDDERDLLLLKDIIFKMYQTSEDEFNYTAMLLDFCKDENQILGFVKALELSLGKFICYDREWGENFVNQLLEDRLLFEQQKKEHEENVNLAKKAVNILVDKILDDDEAEGFDLREIEEQESSPSVENPSDSNSADSELSAGKIISEFKFSYAQIGFDSRDNIAMCYFMPLDLVLIIVNNQVSWNSKVEELEDPSFKDKIIEIFEECRNESFNNVVLTHEFLNCEKLKELFETTNKFLAHNPIKLVRRVLDNVPISEEFVGVKTSTSSELS